MGIINRYSSGGKKFESDVTDQEALVYGIEEITCRSCGEINHVDAGVGNDVEHCDACGRRL